MRTASLEVVNSYRSSIAEKRQRDVEADKNLREAILSKIEATRECRMLIAGARDDLGDKEFAQATSFLNDRAIKSYLRFAKSNPEPISDLENALRAVHVAMQTSGALEFQSGHGPQVCHGPPPFFAWVSREVIQFKLRFSKFINARPLDTWTRDEAEIFLYSLQPILNLAKRIHEWIRIQR